MRTNECKSIIASQGKCALRVLQCVVVYCSDSNNKPSPTRDDVMSLLISKFAKEYQPLEVENLLRKLEKAELLAYQSAFRFVSTPRGTDFVRTLEHLSKLYPERYREFTRPSYSPNVFKKTG